MSTVLNTSWINIPWISNFTSGLGWDETSAVETATILNAYFPPWWSLAGIVWKKKKNPQYSSFCYNK